MSRSLDERLQKLKQLQSKKSDALKQNREELFREHKKQSLSESKLRSLSRKQSKTQEELDKIESKERGEDYERKKGWDYSIEDHEKWDKKQEGKSANVKNSGFVNYSHLAEQSYKKEISQLNVDKEKYLTSRKEDEEENVPDFKNKPSKAAVDNLISTISGSDSRKLKRRKDYKDTENYINDKNKQFNEKLSRHYDKYKE